MFGRGQARTFKTATTQGTAGAATTLTLIAAADQFHRIKAITAAYTLGAANSKGQLTVSFGAPSGGVLAKVWEASHIRADDSGAYFTGSSHFQFGDSGIQEEAMTFNRRCEITLSAVALAIGTVSVVYE